MPQDTRALHVDEFGDSGDVLILLHGLGANRGVWGPLLDLAKSEWKGRILVPDLAGHGRSPASGHYSLGGFASGVADLVEPSDRVFIIGHSLGGAVGSLLATGWFGISVEFVLALSVKLKWSAEEISGGRAVGQKPLRWFDTREAANDWYLKISGLAYVPDRMAQSIADGVVEEGGRFRLAADQKIFGCAAAGVDAIFRAAACPVAQLTGASDPIAPADAIREFGFDVSTVPGAKHYVLIEDPASVWAAFKAGAASTVLSSCFG